MMRREHGFTLIELMVVLIILGILAAIAIPSYNHYIDRSWEEKAKTGLQENALFLERMNARFFGYTTTRGGGANSEQDRKNAKIKSSDLPVQNLCDSSSCGRNYHYAIYIPDSLDEYTLVAIPQGTQATRSQCGAFVLNSNGKQFARFESGGNYDQDTLLKNPQTVGKDVTTQCFK